MSWSFAVKHYYILISIHTHGIRAYQYSTADEENHKHNTVIVHVRMAACTELGIVHKRMNTLTYYTGTNKYILNVGNIFSSHYDLPQRKNLSSKTSNFQTYKSLGL